VRLAAVVLEIILYLVQLPAGVDLVALILVVLLVLEHPILAAAVAETEMQMALLVVLA
jgi:hypothetical protein